MKRRSRGEQMLAAAGLAAPASVVKSAQQPVSLSKDEELKSPPAKRARPSAKSGSPIKTSPRQGLHESTQQAPEAFKLPADLELLASMFDALRTGRMMLKRRAEKVTYNNVRKVVESMTKREFRVEHVAQIKYLRPESFDWQYIRTPSPSNPSQMEIQLLLTFDRQAASGADGSAGRYSGALELADFKARLEEYAKANPVDPETGKVPPVPQAQLPLRPTGSGLGSARSGSLPLGGLPSPSTSLGGRAGSATGLLPAASCPPGMLPDLQVPTALAGLSSPSSSGMSGASPSLTRSRSRLGLPPGALPPSLTPILEGGTPAQQKAGQLHLQRGPSCGESNDQTEADVMLEDEQEAPCGELQPAAEGPMLELAQREASVTTTQRTGLLGCAITASTPQSKGPRPAALQTTPTSQQQPPGDGKLARLHSLLSPAAMQKILQAEAAQAAQTPGAKRRGEMRRAVQLLPHGHELVRHIFGLQGPTVKPLAQVAQAMCERSTQRQGLTARDASNTLVALARAVPEFLRIEDPRVMADGSARPRSVVISRAGNINAIATKLKALVADPDAAVQAIFERGGGPAGAAVRDESPSRSLGAATAAPGAVPDSPAAHLKPRTLAQSLDDGASSDAGQGGLASNLGLGTDSNGTAGSAASARAGGDTIMMAGPPPNTPSSRRRPPGLPLAPLSPAMGRGGQTPTRSIALHSDRRVVAPGGGSILAGVHPAALAAGAPPRPAVEAGPAGELQAKGPAAAELVQRLCRTGTAAAGGKSPAHAEREEVGPSAAGPGGKEPQELSGRTPGRGTTGGRTPGRTAVQEEMLNSIRRSSAKRSCRKVLDEELGVDGEGADEEAEPRPRRLEEFLD